MIHAAAQEPQDQLHQHDRKEGEEELQGQEEPAVHLAPAATHHCQVNREGNEGDVVEGSRAGQVFGAHHDFTQARAQQPAALLLPVKGHGPQAQAGQVADGAPQDEHRHVAPHLALTAEQTGHHGDQDDDVQAEGWEQQQNFRCGAEGQVGRDAARASKRVIRRKRVQATGSATVGREGGLLLYWCTEC